jgi:hypothetical protein
MRFPDLLRDPLIRLVMESDGVTEQEMNAVMDQLRRPWRHESVACAPTHHEGLTPSVRFESGCHQRIGLRDRQRGPTVSTLWLFEPLRGSQADRTPIDRQRRSLQLRAS